MAEIRVKLVPFPLPDGVYQETPPRPKQEGFHPNPGIPLEDLDPVVLSDLCDEFRHRVFTRAGKKDPRLEFGEPL